MPDRRINGHNGEKIALIPRPFPDDINRRTRHSAGRAGQAHPLDHGERGAGKLGPFPIQIGQRKTADFIGGGELRRGAGGGINTGQSRIWRGVFRQKQYLVTRPRFGAPCGRKNRAGPHLVWRLQQHRKRHCHRGGGGLHHGGQRGGKLLG